MTLSELRVRRATAQRIRLLVAIVMVLFAVLLVFACTSNPTAPAPRAPTAIIEQPGRADTLTLHEAPPRIAVRRS